MTVIPHVARAVTGATLSLGLAAVMLRAAPVRADLYTYTDAKGITHYTNVPSHSGYRRIPWSGSTRTRSADSPPVSGQRGRERYAPLIAHAAADTGLPAGLLHAVIKVESNYNPDAVSRKGAIGLMQLMPETARRYGVDDPRDPRANVFGGARYLKNLMTLFDFDVPLALAAYNAGPEAVTRYGRTVPPYAETRRYVPLVLESYRQHESR